MRGFRLPGWSGLAGDWDLMGGGDGVYQFRSDRLPPGFAPDLFAMLVNGADRTLHWLTDPSNWRSAEGEFKGGERWINWVSVRIGLDALDSMGEHWTTDESLWAAFRALGILQGIWEGAAQADISLQQMWNPEILRQEVIPSLPESQREWAEDLTIQFEKELLKLSDDLVAAGAVVEEIRHLVHGAGAAPSRKRTREARLEAVRSLDRKDPPRLHIIRDIANL